MSIAGLAALPVIGQVASAAGDIVKAVAPLIQPFVDVAAKTLEDSLKSNDDQQNKSMSFASAQDNNKSPLTF